MFANDPTPKTIARLSWPAVALFLLAGLAAALAFAPSGRNDFLSWDDEINFTRNQDFRGIGWDQIKWAFTTTRLGPYQPLSWISISLDYAFWGLTADGTALDPYGFHVTNIIIHALNAWLFAMLATRFYLLHLRPPPKEKSVRPNASAAAVTATPHNAIAFGLATALLWALHPMRVEAVSWATERRELLAGFFTLLTLNLHVARRHFVWVFAAALAAMLSKGTSVVLPVLLVAIDFYRLRVIEPADMVRSAGRAAVRYAPYFALSLIFSIVAVVAQPEDAAVGFDILTLPQRLGLVGRSVAFYAWKFLVPVNLAIIYEAPPIAQFSELNVEFALSWFATLAALASAWFFRRKAACAWWLLITYIVMVLPISGLMQHGAQLAADRYAYQPSLALSLLLVAGWIALVARAASRKAGLAVAALLPIAVLSLIPLTLRQQKAWRSTDALWSHQVDVYPQSFSGRFSHAMVFIRQQPPDYASAEPHLLEAVRLHPAYAEAHRALANLYLETDRMELAIKHFQQALRCTSTQTEMQKIQYGIARLYWITNQRDKAIQAFREVVRLAPPVTGDLGAAPLSDAQRVLARALAANGDMPGAVSAYRTAIESAPTMPYAAMELAELLATHPDPRFRDPAAGLQWITISQQRFDKALSTGGDRSLHHNVRDVTRVHAIVLASLGQFENAVTELERLRPRVLNDARYTGIIDQLLDTFRSRKAISRAPQYNP